MVFANFWTTIGKSRPACSHEVRMICVERTFATQAKANEGFMNIPENTVTRKASPPIASSPEMQELVPLQITFRNVQRSGAVTNVIESEMAKLQRYFDRLTSCRVIVEAPNRHHRSGDPFHIRIDLDVPREKIVIKHSPALRCAIARAAGKSLKHLEPDVPHKDIYLAVRDAFTAARRRLEVYSRRLRGDIKIHHRIPPGRVDKLI
jgi:ribosome-associated translation inhibitor RaiA